jgi:hypothetical protein
MQHPPGADAAMGAKTAHVIRDFLRDCEEGLFNVSRQEIAAYRLNLKDMTRDCAALSVRRWVAAKVRLADRQLQTGLHDAASCGGFRYRLIVAVLIAKYQTYLDQFRGDRFVLKSHTSLHWGHFLKHLIANIGAVTSWKNGYRPASLSIKRLGNLAPISAIRRLPLRWRLLPSRNGSIVKLFRDSISGSDIPDADMRKMTRRFVVAYWLGYTSFAGINAKPYKADAGQAHLAGLVYAYWSIAVMEFDSLVDDHDLPLSAAESIVSAWLAEMGEAIRTCAHAKDGRIGAVLPAQSDAHLLCDRFQRLTRALNGCLVHYSLRVLDARQRDRAYQAFSREAQVCLAAQIQSRLQKAVDPPYDWGWYLIEMLNQKTLGFVLAPFNLWCRSDATCEQRRTLERAFLKLNSAYFHWQLLDDVADIDSDMEHGLVTGPGFILLSQGSIARRYLDVTTASERCGDAEMRDVEAAVDRSKLLCEWFASSPLCDRYRHFFATGDSMSAESLQHLVRCALANCECDLDVPLSQLCAARDQQSQDYLTAMKSREWTEARRHLAASRASVRIMLAAQEEAAREMARTEMGRVEDGFLLKTLDIIEMLARHCGAKARRLAVQE